MKWAALLTAEIAEDAEMNEVISFQITSAISARSGEPGETRGRRFSTEKSLTPKRRCSGNPFRVHPHSVRGAPRLYGLGVPP